MGLAPGLEGGGDAPPAGPLQGAGVAALQGARRAGGCARKGGPTGFLDGWGSGPWAPDVAKTNTPVRHRWSDSGGESEQAHVRGTFLKGEGNHVLFWVCLCHHEHISTNFYLLSVYYCGRSLSGNPHPSWSGVVGCATHQCCVTPPPEIVLPGTSSSIVNCPLVTLSR